MKDRCYRKKNKNFILYGGRGIKVCDRWLESFESFLEDMGEKPSRFHSLDRINVNGNYEPSNCKWSTQKEQCVNRRTVKNLEKEIIILKKHIEIKNKIIDAYITRLEKA